jgi:serine/threonine protein kinase
MNLASKQTAIDSPASLVGRTLDGRFRIVSALARGGMGAVYRAEQLPLGRAVAIKILSLRHDEDQDPEFRKRFLLEASTAAKLTHPNTVRVFDYGQTEDGLYFIAMELLEGLTLKETIAKEGAIDAERAVDIAKQIGRSLREAHRLGIVHRDMKPGNVMLVSRGGDETVKVLDFGLAKDTTPVDGEVEDITQTGVFMGSPKYMSPEQIQGEKLDARSDIYSVGVMLYEMLSGRPPFVRDQPMQVLMDHIREPAPLVMAPEGREPLPHALTLVTMRCLAKHREDRFADMDQFLLALKESLGGPTSSSGQIAAMTGEFDALTSSGVLHLSSTGSGPNAGVAAKAAPVALGTIPTIDIEMASEPAPPPSRRNVYLGVGIVVVALALVGIGLTAMGGSSDTPTSDPIASAPPTPVEPTATETETGTVAPPVTPPVVAPPAVEAAPIRTLLVSLGSTPSGAMVHLGDRTYGPTPAQVELTGELAAEGSSLHFVFTRAGFRDTPVDVSVDAAGVASGRLEVSPRLLRIFRATGGGGATHEGTGDGEQGASDVRVEGYRDSPY